MVKDREYLYTVEIRGKKLESGGYEWHREQHKATSIVEVSRVRAVKLDDIHYITKELVK